ncbi:hypothetical protein KDJ21_011490 [Metabacillus litoralis]|uniref:hypothetical protein n=1 Tax=Metabacillus litoralis TaxID=152268 RepID=UPI001E60A3C8|nr:hypothetical protein [Metabacillus litoralis]UHA62180.1 hypothetical protein KDJ21_011490 [Metabacillus litoralis]
MRKHSFIMLVIILVLLSGCTQSEESLRNESIDHTKQAFDNEELEVNEKADQFSFYLPNDFKIKEKMIIMYYLKTVIKVISFC